MKMLFLPDKPSQIISHRGLHHNFPPITNKAIGCISDNINSPYYFVIKKDVGPISYAIAYNCLFSLHVCCRGLVYSVPCSLWPSDSPLVSITLFSQLRPGPAQAILH